MAQELGGQLGLKEQMQQDLDEISSIYTAHELTKKNMQNLEMTIKNKINFKRERNRFSIMNEGDMNDIMNINKILEFGCDFKNNQWWIIWMCNIYSQIRDLKVIDLKIN